jgi:hypothetical protein
MVTIPVIDDVPFTANQRLACSVRVWAGVPPTLGQDPWALFDGLGLSREGRSVSPQTLLGCLLMPATHDPA